MSSSNDHQNIAGAVEHLRQMIRGGELAPGEKLPTLRALASRCGTNFGRARLAVAQLEREGLVDCVQGSGTYVKMQQLPDTDAAPGSLAGAVWLFLDPRTRLFGELETSLVDHLQRRGVMPIKANWRPDQGMTDIEHLFEHWKRQAPRAILVQGSADAQFDRAVRLATPAGTRIITLLRHHRTGPCQWHDVSPDLAGAYQLAAEYLIEREHRCIGVVAKPRQIVPHWRHTHRKSRMSHTEAILAVGHALSDAGIRHGLKIHYAHSLGEPEAADVEQLVRWLRQTTPRLTAIVTDDFRVSAVKVAAAELGLSVPQDLAIIGVGDSVPQHLVDYPMVRTRYETVAREAVKIALSPAGELGETVRHLRVPPHLTAPTSSNLYSRSCNLAGASA